MAKSDSDSNGLRQDQPECPEHEARGLAGAPIRVQTPLRGPCPVRRSADRPGGTELPGLTSDPILTADRRGGILISSGPEHCPRWVINPSNRDERRPAAFAFASECPVTLKGVGPGPPRRGDRGHPASGCRSRSHPNALLHLRASDRDRHRAAAPGTPRGASFAFHPEEGVALKAVVPTAPRNPLTCGGFTPTRRGAVSA
jgi:hypothetical protein